MKRILASLLTLAIIVGCFAGCSNNGSKKVDSQKDNKENTITKGDSKTEEPVTLEWLAYNCYEQPDAEAPVVKKVEEKFNVKFNFWFLDDKNWNQSLNIKLAAGEIPDIMRLKGNVATLVDQDILAEIPKDMIKEKAPDYYSAVDVYAEDYNVWLYGSYKGKRYSIPRLNADGKYPTVLVWRKDWLKNIGYDAPPKTLEEFEDVMYKFRNNDPDQNGEKDTYGLSDRAFNAIYGAFGVQSGPDFKKSCYSVLMKDGEPKICDVQPEMKQALTYLEKWYKDGVIDPEFITGENTGGYWGLSHAFMNGKIGVTGRVMYYHYLDADAVGLEPELDDEGYNKKNGGCYTESLKVNPDIKIELSGGPVGPDGKEGTDGWGMASEGFGITKNAIKDDKKMDKIWQLLNEPYVDEEYNKLVMWGIEGIHYTMEEGVRKTITKADDNKFGGEKSGIMVFVPSFIPIKENDPKNEYSLRQAYLKKVASHHGYVAYPLKGGEATQQYGAALGTFRLEEFVKFISGERPLNEWDDFVKEFNNMGGTEVQKGLTDEFNQLMNK